MINVLFFIPTLDRGGAENVLVNLVNHMDHGKFCITVQTLFDKDSQKNLLDKQVKYKSIMNKQFHGNSRIIAMISPKWLYKHIIKDKYDIVVSYLEGPTAYILSGCPYKETKKVAWIHTAFDSEKSFCAGFKSKKSAIKAYQSYDKLAFVAQTAKESFIEIANASLPKCKVVYNTLDSIEVINQSKEEIDNNLFLNNHINIISTGKIDAVKGYDRLAHIHKRLLDAGIINEVFLLGVGSQQKDIERYLIENQLTETFHFLGFQSNPYKYVSKADLFVCSSRREGFSTSVSEALVLGVPVVTTSCSGMFEMLGANNEYGIVTENNENALYEGVRKMITTPGMLQQYAQRAKERGKMFSIDNTVNAVEEMLLEL